MRSKKILALVVAIFGTFAVGYIFGTERTNVKHSAGGNDFILNAWSDTSIPRPARYIEGNNRPEVVVYESEVDTAGIVREIREEISKRELELNALIKNEFEIIHSQLRKEFSSNNEFDTALIFLLFDMEGRLKRIEGTLNIRNAID